VANFNLRRAALLGVIPLVGGVFLVGSLILRMRPAAESSGAAVAPRNKAKVVRSDWEEKPLVIAQAVPRPTPAPEKTVAARSEEVRIRSTYQNYRTAIATNNSPLEHALRPVFLRDRDSCLALAQEELAKAQTEFDRDVARKVIESMRR
jgi:hypothetical protein